MSQNQEIIESKLCAFLDGELDEAGRADIEKHLTANPQHRRLLEELRRTSALLRDLPRENAPPELAESFNAQLERSVLLQGIGEEAGDGSMRIGAGPRFYAAAAIILLMIGLAAVIYFALPSGNVRPQMANSAVHAPTPLLHGAAPLSTTERAVQPAIEDQETPGKEQNGAPVESLPLKQAAAQKRRVPEEPLAEGRLEELQRLRQLAREAANDDRALNDINSIGIESRAQTRAAVIPSVGPGALVMLVDSDDLDRTHLKLETYFAAEGIIWAPGNEPDAAKKSKLEAAATGNRELALRFVGDRSKSDQNRAVRAQSPGQEIAPAAIPGPSTEPTTQPHNIGNFGFEAPGAIPQTAPFPAADGPTTAPVLSENPVAGPPQPATRPAAQEAVFAARMSRQQAAALGQALEREGAAQQTRLLHAGESLNSPSDKVEEKLALNRGTVKTTVDLDAISPASRPSAVLDEAARKEPENDQLNKALQEPDNQPTTQPLASAIPTTRPSAADATAAFAVKDKALPPTTAPSGLVAATAPLAAPSVAKPSASPIQLSQFQSTTQPAGGNQDALSLDVVDVVIVVRSNVSEQRIVPAVAGPQTQPIAPATEPTSPNPAPASQPDTQ